MARTKNIMRVLSVFVAVVIVSVVCLQPVAYANAVLVGGALVLLMAALLVASGMTFTSQAQLDAAASYATNKLPTDLKQELEDFIIYNPHGFNIDSNGNVNPNPPPKKPDFRDIFNGITGTASVLYMTTVLILKVREFIYNTFGINEETVAGKVVTPMFAVITYEEFQLPVLISVKEFAIEHFGESAIEHPLNNFFVLDKYGDGKSFVLVASNYKLNYCTDSYGNPPSYQALNGNVNSTLLKPDYGHVVFSTFDSGSMKLWSPVSNAGDSFRAIGSKVIYSSYDISNYYYSSLVSTWQYQGVYYDMASNCPISSITVSQEAYSDTPTGEALPVRIYQTTGEYVGTDYTEATNKHWENFDWAGAVNQVSQDLGALTGSVAGLGSLPQDIVSLQNELTILSSQLASQTSQAVESAEYAVQLNDALVNAYTAMQNMSDAVSGDVAVTAEQIAELTNELVQARNEIALLNGTISGTTPDVDNPDNPPEVKEGEIDWSPLKNLRSFTGVFPFCIPFDIISMFKSLAATPEAPRFEIPFKYGDFIDTKIEIDLSFANDIMPFVRFFILIDFAVALAWATGKVIKW